MGTGTTKNKIKFKVGEAEYCVVRPDAKLQNKAQLFKAKKTMEMADGGALLREQADKYLRERKVWDEEKENLYSELVKSLKEDEVKLAGAKKAKMKLAEAKDLTFKMASTFQSIQSLQFERSSLDYLTAESMASNAEFDFLLANCTRNADGSHYYTGGYEEMTEKEECPVYEKAKEAYMDLIHGPYQEQLKKRPEWKFLIEHKFVDDQLRPIDKDGNLVDGFGRKINEKGQLINEKGQLVNGNGELVDELGFLLGDDEGYFTDDEGNPIGSGPFGTATMATAPAPSDAPVKHETGPVSSLAHVAESDSFVPGFVGQEVIDAVS